MILDSFLRLLYLNQGFKLYVIIWVYNVCVVEDSFEKKILNLDEKKVSSKLKGEGSLHFL